jgi:hypothetical protein
MRSLYMVDFTVDFLGDTLVVMQYVHEVLVENLQYVR